MGPAVLSAQDNDGPSAAPQFEEPKNRCLPSERIIHFFLDDVSSAEKKDLTNHFSRCDLCSARLLALEISAQVSLTSARGTAKSTTVVVNPTATACGADHGSPSSTRRRRRSQRANVIAIDALEDRDLLTAITGPFDPGALNRGAEIEPRGVPMARARVESRRNDARDYASVAAFSPRHWDLAIDEIVGAALFPHVATTTSGTFAAA
jgi:hypothetical protein